MTSQQILNADFLDILFDNRNKAYGAYDLRRHYNRQLIKALGITFPSIFLLLLFVSPSGPSNGPVNKYVDEGHIITPFDIPKVAPPKLVTPAIALPKSGQPVKSAILTNFLFTKDPVINTMPSLDNLNDVQINNVADNGVETKGSLSPSTGNGNVAGTISQAPDLSKKAIAPDRQPQFPGGMQAWINFLNKNLRSPEDLETGDKRIVNIRFHVDVDGTVTNFQIVQSGGTAFDNEVIRVLKRMPKWSPAMQGGEPVAISFTQPVTFVGQGE